MGANGRRSRPLDHNVARGAADPAYGIADRLERHGGQARFVEAGPWLAKASADAVARDRGELIETPAAPEAPPELPKPPKAGLDWAALLAAWIAAKKRKTPAIKIAERAIAEFTTVCGAVTVNNWTAGTPRRVGISKVTLVDLWATPLALLARSTVGSDLTAHFSMDASTSFAVSGRIELTYRQNASI